MTTYYSFIEQKEIYDRLAYGDRKNSLINAPDTIWLGLLDYKGREVDFTGYERIPLDLFTHADSTKSNSTELDFGKIDRKLKIRGFLFAKSKWEKPYAACPFDSGYIEKLIPGTKIVIDPGSIRISFDNE